MKLKLMPNLTLSQRLSVVFSVLLLACCGASAWLQIRANDLHEEEVVQALSRDLAEHIALNTELITEDGLRPDAVRRLFGQLMVVNPSVEVYLLDKDGRITGQDAPPGSVKRERVDLAPVRQFVDGEPLPILGDDPRSVNARKVFSAAPLRAAGRDLGYVYVVLLGEARARLDARVAASTILRTTLLSMGLVALLGLLAGLMAFALITRPLRRLTEKMRHFDTDAESSALAHAPAAALATAQAAVQAAEPLAAQSQPLQSSLDRHDEIVVLEAAFGQMAGRINEQWRALRQQDQQRRELVANISHDLRTPLTSLHGYLETLSLKADTLSDAERRRYLGIALSQSRKVGLLAQSLFELARLEHGFVHPVLENFSLADLVQDVFQKFELSAQAKQVRLSANLSNPLPIVSADLAMIERVLTNLLDNAIRHTPSAGSVDVDLRRHDGKVAVTVSDSGPGIPAELHESLFRRPLSFSGPSTGGGLGLLIVQRMLQLHHSQIRLMEAAGTGAKFYFELPVARF